MIHLDFKTHLLAQYQQYCQQSARQPDPADFVDYLVERNLIQPPALRAYLVKAEYSRLKQQAPQRNKAALVEEIADRFHLSRRQVIQMIRHIQS